MKAFDPNYKLLDEMYQDDYYPAFLVDKVKDELQKVIDLLESGETDTEVIQETLDEAVCGINDLQEEFDENDSEIETVARDCIGVTVAYILEWFGIPMRSLTRTTARSKRWPGIVLESLWPTFWSGSAFRLILRRPSEKGTGENNVH